MESPADFYARLLSGSEAGPGPRSFPQLPPAASRTQSAAASHEAGSRGASGRLLPASAARPTTDSTAGLGRNGGGTLESWDGGGGANADGLGRQVPAYSISQSNVGYKLLKKAGWSEEHGLGAGEQGRLQPVVPQMKADKKGIGVTIKKPSVDADKAKRKRKRVGGVRKKDDDDEVPESVEQRSERRKALAHAEKDKLKEQAIRQYLAYAFAPDNV
eukprot:jgi/Chlat1/3882/Chrsp26S04170